MKYGIIFRGNSSNIKKTFTVPNKIFRIMVGTRPRNLCNNMFKRLKMSPLHFNSYFFKINLNANNKEKFQTNPAVTVLL